MNNVSSLVNPNPIPRCWWLMCSFTSFSSLGNLPCWRAHNPTQFSCTYTTTYLFGITLLMGCWSALVVEYDSHGLEYTRATCSALYTAAGSFIEPSAIALLAEEHWIGKNWLLIPDCVLYSLRMAKAVHCSGSFVYHIYGCHAMPSDDISPLLSTSIPPLSICQPRSLARRSSQPLWRWLNHIYSISLPKEQELVVQIYRMAPWDNCRDGGVNIIVVIVALIQTSNNKEMPRISKQRQKINEILQCRTTSQLEEKKSVVIPTTNPSLPCPSCRCSTNIRVPRPT